MSPRRHPPISTWQALAGTAGLLAIVAVVVATSHVLLLPVETVAPLPATQEVPDEPQRAPGEVVCPTVAEVDARMSPIEVTSAQLIECPESYDGEKVEYAGEAVGAVLLRPDQAWLHLNDDRYALVIGPLSRHRTVVGGNAGMAVSVPRATAIGVEAGHARRHGTRLRVVGTFLRSDDTDAGSPSIRATEVEVTHPAEEFTTPVSSRRVVAAALLVPATGLLAWRLRRSKRAL